MPRIRNERGLGLVEVLIFVAILAIVTLGVTSFLVSTSEQKKQSDIVDTMKNLSNFATREIFNSRTLYWSVNSSSGVPSTLNRELYRCIMKDGIACGNSTFYAMLVPGIPTAAMTYPTQRFAGLGSIGAAGDWEKRVLYGKDGALCPVGNSASEFCPIEVSVSMVCADEGCASTDRVGYLRVTLRIETVWNGTGVPEGIRPIVRTELVKIVPPKGTLLAWGENASGEIGDGSSSQRNAPVWISAVNNLVEVSSTGNGTSCGITDVGGLLCWGQGFTSTPATAFNLVNGVREVAPYRDYGCYLSTMGAVKCWGTNSHGELGDGTTNDSATPVSVSGLSRGVVGITVGMNHACALNTSGGVKCWGYNFKGQLGDGTTTDRKTPVDVTGLTSGVAQISAKLYTTCAVTTSGGAKCWGENASAQLGDGTSTDRSTPVDVSSLTSGVLAISTGGIFGCALTTGGGVKCWGNNVAGQIGTGATSTAVTSPTDVSGLTSNVQMISSYAKHTCAVKTDGSVKCWGGNTEGEIGDGTTNDRYTPTQPTSLWGNVLQVGAGQKHNLAITATSDTSTGTGTGINTGTGTGVSGYVQVWGTNEKGQFANGETFLASSSPLNATSLGSAVSKVTAGVEFSCALLTSGGAKCWGDNSFGQVGDGTTTSRIVATDVSGLTSGVKDIDSGFAHACAVTTTGAAKCWGQNAYGELGVASTGVADYRSTPVTVTGLTSGVLSVAAGAKFSCARLETGAIKCWGSGANGRLGNGATTDSFNPVDVSGISANASMLTAGDSGHACAIVDGGAKCWGLNANGQLGDGTLTDRNTPVDVSGLTSNVASINAGTSHTCAVTTSGSAKCWGINGTFNLGDGTATDRLTPVTPIGLSTGVAEIAAGTKQTCARTTAGAAKCWGSNTYGEVGDATSSSRSTPTAVTGLSAGVLGIEAGYKISYAITTGQSTGTGSGTGSGVGVSGYAYCWGQNDKNQTGIGNVFTPVLSPMSVDGLERGGSDTRVSDLKTSLDSTCALMNANSSVLCWGSGYLGDGTAHTTYKYPRTATGLTSGVTQITSGLWYGMCAIHSNAMKCWGQSLYLDGSTKANYTTPTAVTGLGNVSFVALSGQEDGNTMCAILSATGGLKCWGFNNLYGLVGDGTTTERFAPVDVSGLTTNVSGVTLGREHGCAFTTSGAAKCWGRNQFNQLGDGTTNTSMTPVAVTGLSSGVTQIVSGFDHTCALVSGGVKCWGRNNEGQLGDGTNTNRSSPVDVTGLTSGVASISAGNYQTCAVKNDGTSYCWGNYYLGNNATSTSLTKVAIGGPGTTALKITASRGDTPVGESGTNCLISSTAPDPTYWRAWGENSSGELRDGPSLQDQNSPIRPYVNPIAFPTAAPALSMGNSSGCFTHTPTGTVWCWGTNLYGELGNGTSAPSSSPVVAPGLVSIDPPTLDLFEHSCALDTTTWKIWCWGRNSYGQVGDNSTTDRSSPVATSDSSLAQYIDTDVGQTHSCGITRNRYLRCWGRNNHGQLGDGTSTDSLKPFKMVTSLLPFTKVSSGKEATCAINIGDGQTYCMGRQSLLGSVAPGDLSSPAAIDNSFALPHVGVSVGESHACSVNVGGSVGCWGSNTYGQLGDGSTNDSTIPVLVSGIANALEVVAGVDASCARLTNGNVKCWGRNNSGQLGNGTCADSSTPVTVSGLSNVVKLGRSNGRSFFAQISTPCDTSGSPFGGGSGTSTDPYQICSAAHFGNITTAPSSYFKVMRDLDLSSLNSSWSPITTFSGTLDGDGHQLRNLSYTDYTTVGRGLFARTLDTGGTLKNIIFAQMQYTLGANQGANSVGGLIANMNSGSTLSNVSGYLIINTAGKTTGSFGGLVGTCAGTISGGFYAIGVGGISEASAGPVGGLVGEFTGNMRQLHLVLANPILLSLSPATPIYGGVVGRSMGGQITEIVLDGGALNVAATVATNVVSIGGIVGHADAGSTLRRVKLKGAVGVGANVTATNVGGIAGAATCDLSDIEMAGSFTFAPTTIITNFGSIAGSYTTATAAMTRVLSIGTIDNVNGVIANYRGHVGVCDAFATYNEVLRSPGLMMRPWAVGCAAAGVTDTYECATCAGVVRDGSCAGAVHNFAGWLIHFTINKPNSTCAAYPHFNLDR